MDDTALQYLIALEKEGSLTRVAERFYISASAVSQSIARQEKELGQPIFIRQGKRMVPTAAGAIYLEGARDVIRIQEETRQQLAELSARHTALTIVCAYELYPEISARVFPALQEACPKSLFDLRAADSAVCREYLLNDLADLALLHMTSLDHMLLDETILGEDLLTAAVPSSLLPENLSRQPVLDDCRYLPFILLKNGCYFRSLENEILIKNHIPFSAVYEVDSFEMARSFLEAKRGVAFLPVSMLPEQEISRISLEPPIRSKKILAFHKYSQMRKEGRTALRIIRERYAAEQQGS